MADTADNLVVASNGILYVGPTYATAPTTAASAAGAPPATGVSGYTDLGTISEDGVTLTRNLDTERIRAWRSKATYRYLLTDVQLQFNCALREWNKSSFPVAMGGGTASGGTYAIPAAAGVDARAWIIDWTDTDASGNDERWRLYFPYGLVTDLGDINLNYTGSADLPITVSIYTSGNTLGTLWSTATGLWP